MGLTDIEIKEIRKELDNSTRPLFLFDDDADGICSYLLLYKYVREGKGHIVKASNCINESFLNIVNEYQPDKVFILDKPDVSQEFIDKVTVDIIWIDHHDVQDRKGIKYYNPKKHNPTGYFPTTYCCYQVVQNNIWLAMVGCIGDWMIPEFSKEFVEKYEGYFDLNITNPSEALFNTKLGLLTKIIWFNLHGYSKDYKKSIECLTKVKEPEEIMEQTSAFGKYVYKRFEKVNKDYEALLGQVNGDTNDKLLLFEYAGSSSISFTAFLSNEIKYKYSDKVVIIAREKNGEVKCSLRSENINVASILEKSLVGIEGRGGGHEKACGAVIQAHNFDQFIKNIRENLN